MQNFDLGTFLDKYIDKYILWVIPKSIKPNYFTYFRIISVPFILYFLQTDKLVFAFILFIISMLTDLIDGALARTRHQITNLGKVLDPVADKLLILTVFVFIGLDKPVVLAFVIFILLEIVSVLVLALLNKRIGKTLPANIFGKVKMWIQCIAILVFFISLITGSPVVDGAVLPLLLLGLAFAVIAGIKQGLILLDTIKS